MSFPLRSRLELESAVTAALRQVLPLAGAKGFRLCRPTADRCVVLRNRTDSTGGGESLECASRNAPPRDASKRASRRPWRTNNRYRGVHAMTSGFFSSVAGRNAKRRVRSEGRPFRSTLARALTAIAVAAIAFGVHAAPKAPLSISPPRIELSTSNPSIVVTVHNDDVRAAMVVRMQPMRWTQGGIAPHYESTPDVIATPDAFVVAPGETKSVQVDLLSSANSIPGRDFQLFWMAQTAPPEAAAEAEAQAGDKRAAP